MRSFIAAGLLVALAVLTSPSAHAETILTCPDLSTLEEVGTCPSKEEVKAQQKRTCLMERNEDNRKLMACDDFPEYYARKANSLWAAQINGEEHLTYRGCVAPSQKAESTKPTKMRAKSPNRFSWMFCSYPNDETITFKLDMNCKLENGEKAMDCGPDGKACRLVCE